MAKTERLLNRLPDMGIAQLRNEWRLFYRTEASTSMSAKLLRQAVAYRIQELDCGASARCEALRQKAAAAPKRPEDDGYGYAHRLKPGTRLLREYEGKVHEVLAVENGRFVYAGQVFRSLSEVAERIRGVRTAGGQFFGLRRKRRPDAAGG